MTVLVVDDQTSVLKGIEQGVNFKGAGIEKVYLADSAAKAREIILTNYISILLCDIEMPGEDGLSLNRWVKEKYPDIVRILLTSHAEFSYAQESVRLGCFDYILQPAPFDEIEAALKRAVKKIHVNEDQKRLRQKGEYYEKYQDELMNKVILNLYSPNSESVSNAISELIQAGFSISQNSATIHVIIDIYSFADRSNPDFSDEKVREAIFEAVRATDESLIRTLLLSENRLHQYVMLFAGDINLIIDNRNGLFQSFYDNLEQILAIKPAIYIGEPYLLRDIRKSISGLIEVINNNVSQTPGVYYQEEYSGEDTESLDLSQNIMRWERMLENMSFDQAEKSIISYTDLMSSIGRLNFNDICDLHQLLMQMFFNFAYAHNINIMDMFSKDYTYNDFLGSFANTAALKNGVHYLTKTLSKVTESEKEVDDVESAKQYIRNNISKDILVKDVADYVHRNPEYFTKVFKEETGVSLKSYITNLKMETAKDMLAMPNMSISVVAMETGYDNFSHFTQVFKKIEGITPTEYRKKLFGHDDQNGSK